MYIEYIKVKNFGVHGDKEVHLVDGLVVVRSPNGAGKSTLMIQAPLYAMFGTSTLDATLDETVTRGNPVSKLQVEVKYGPYVVKRSKSSASVKGPDVEISGQAPVSNFFYELLDIHKGTESMILVSEQGDTSGILKKRPGEVTTFIETLAGFDQIDDLIEKVKEVYPSGYKSVLEDRLEALTSKKDSMESQELPDVESLKLSLVDKESKLQSIDNDMTKLNQKQDELDWELKKSLEHNRKIDSVSKDIDNEIKNIDRLKVDAARMEGELSSIEVFDKTDLDSAQSLLDNFDLATEKYAAWKWCQDLSWEGDVWEGGFRSFSEELETTARVVRKSEKSIKDGESDLKVLKSKLVLDKTCPTCKQDVEHLHKEMNETTQKEIFDIEHELGVDRNYCMGQKSYLQVLNAINSEHIRRQKWCPKHVTVNTTTVPHTYSAEEVGKPDQKAVNIASKLLSDWKSSLTKKKTLESELERTYAKLGKSDVIERLHKQLKELGPKEQTEATELAIKLVKDEVTRLFNDQSIVRKEVSESEKEIARAEEVIKNHEKVLKEVGEDIKSTEQELVIDAKNGRILKAVRDAKPKVLDTIWSKILLSVSTIYSSMLGFEAKVEKDTKGFRINDLPVSRLSGSEKSTLGIALRATLRDVFAPSCGTMFWDEIAADCDADRTAAVMAAVQSIPGQHVIITHEDQSELAADQVVEV